MWIKNEVKRLLQIVPRPPEADIPAGTKGKSIERLAKLFSKPLPEELIAWLRLCNGPSVGPGGLFGVPPAPKWLQIEWHLQQHPAWLKKMWIPIAGDGLGNYYVTDASEDVVNHCPVYFVDHEISYDEPCYVVASSLWHFLYFLLQRETETDDTKADRWPFEKGFVLNTDPDIKLFEGRLPLPWNV